MRVHTWQELHQSTYVKMKLSYLVQRLVAPLDWHQFRCISRHQNPPGANQLAPLIIANSKVRSELFDANVFCSTQSGTSRKSIKTIDTMSNTDYDSVKALLILVQRNQHTPGASNLCARYYFRDRPGRHIYRQLKMSGM
jgi:hypothetical protein